MGLSGRTRPGTPVAEQLEDVVTQAHHDPLGVNGVDAAHRELSESPGVLDLAVDGLDHRLATRVQRSALGSVESPPHPLERVEFIGRVAGARGRSPIPMSDPCGPRKAVKGDTSCSLRSPDVDHTGIALGWEDIRHLSEGTATRRITDDTLPGGPIERHIEYSAPFDRCDREQDYCTAWTVFARQYRHAGE